MTARVLVTGAASGIGAATAGALRQQGAAVVGLDRNAAAPPSVRADLRDAGQVRAAVAAAVAKLGSLDVLINCAGIGDAQRAGDQPGPEVEAILDINLLGTWRVTAAALPALRQSGGRVVNVASGLALLTLPYAAAYCASKRALVGFSDALRLEEWGRVWVTTVYPGYIRTPIHEAPARKGVSLEGLVPAEDLDDAVRTLVRAALGRPARDLATTRRGALAHALLRWLPPSLLDRAIRVQLRRAERRGASISLRTPEPATVEWRT